MAASIKQQRH